MLVLLCDKSWQSYGNVDIFYIISSLIKFVFLGRKGSKKTNSWSTVNYRVNSIPSTFQNPHIQLWISLRNFVTMSEPYSSLRLEILAAEPQPQAFDSDWYSYRKIRECKRKTSLFFYHVIPTDIICLWWDILLPWK